MFAKLYDTDEHGQVLVKIDQSESDEHSGPEVRVYFEPEGLGVCSFAFHFTDNDDGWDAAERRFEESHEEVVVEAINSFKEKFAGLFNVTSEPGED